MCVCVREREREGERERERQTDRQTDRQTKTGARETEREIVPLYAVLFCVGLERATPSSSRPIIINLDKTDSAAYQQVGWRARARRLSFGHFSF